ncbi:iron complex transport system permease protein [Serratia fonticola]|uniref:Iron complex transport system permease protein n=1 Tax=Serratia fonticola TaxID=47917 RepID=A0A542D017_SERFO|nr:iron complex transport system permease protein [Serratia fonticola]TQI96428.1 iron complex transport system permease protein [Serratia fonticola]TVZ70925.1 iron complex transport system permease protein [Serratia fonticola]
MFLGLSHSFWLRLLGLLSATVVLLLVMMLSLSLGAKSISFTTVIAALNGQCQGADCVIITEARLPRTLIGVLAGIALGLAGALMQTLTRNPIADPGILGVNSGAGFAVVLGITFFGATNVSQYLWFAFAGALGASLLVALIGALGGSRINPVRLTLAGVALAAVLEGMTSGISLLNPLVFDQLRFWQAGSLDIQNMAVVRAVAPPILLGTLITLWLSKALNSLNMGNELAAALGTGIVRTQLLGLLAITLLCGGATAAVGPIAFVGLMMPHIARRLAGSELHWMLPWTLVLTPILMLSADLLGRFLVSGELQVSIVLSLLGAPMLIVLVRQRHMFRRGG